MNTWISWKTDRLVFLILLGLIFLSHLPFIDADPDRNMSVGRGPFTDEGLNTIQARNWVNHHGLGLSECDNLLKTPFFGFPLAVTYKIFGISLPVSRLHVLVLLFLGLLVTGLSGKKQRIMIIFSIIALLEYRVFQSSHFSMAEMLSVAAILLSVHYLGRSLESEPGQIIQARYAVLSAIFLSLSYYIKIQFIYLILMLPLALIFLRLRSGKASGKLIIRSGILAIATLLFFGLLYFFAWYLPNKTAYDYMMAHQSGGFSLSGKTLEYVIFSLEYHFLKGWTIWFICVFLVLMISGFLLLKRSDSPRYPVLFFSSLAWFLLELHKLAMAYLPTRYQVSLFASMGLMMSIVINELISWPAGRSRWAVRMLAFALLLIPATINIYNYIDTYRHRTFVIRDTNRYLARSLDKNDLVLGAWGPALTWDSKSKTLPVWNNFLNYQDPITKYHPRVIIAETDEQDSEKAWTGHGIELQKLADSTKTVQIGHWDVVIYWMK